MNESTDIKLKHWSSKLISIFGMWLWKKGEYGHALLCITGPQWSFKIGQQLSITWNDMFDVNHDSFYLDIPVRDKSEYIRHVSGLAGQYIELAYETFEIENMNDSLYINSKTGKPLTTSSLNRELKRFSKQFIKEQEEKLEAKLYLKELKSNAFQIAWGLSTVKKYYYSKKSFVAVSRFLGHRTLKDTISLLEVSPNDEIEFDFAGILMAEKLGVNVLDNTKMLEHYTEYAMSRSDRLKKMTIT